MGLKSLSLFVLAILPCSQALQNSSWSYPSSSGLDTTRWEKAAQKVDDLIGQLNVTEKSLIVTGTMDGTCIMYVAPIPRIGFGGLCMQDGPASVRLADKVNVYPAGLTAAASWDKSLIYSRGSALAKEFRGKGVHVSLGPMPGPLGRSPWGGRNWEGFSPDPYLTGVATDLTIRAIQDQGVQSSVKHFIGNEQETQRKQSTVNGQTVEAVSSNIDDRTMHELYLWPFADAVHAGVTSVMCAYNRVNSTYACENPKLLNGLLKGELGFQGYVASDFFATKTGLPSINAGLDVNLPGPISPTDLGNSYFGNHVITAVQNGSLAETKLNNMVHRILTPYYYLAQNEDYPTIDPATYYLTIQFLGLLPKGISPPSGRDVRGDNKKLIRELGVAGTVLLKNENNILPLKKTSNLGVFGTDAADSAGLSYPEAGYETGTIVIGGGSGSGRSPYIVSPLDAIKARAAEGDVVQYITDTSTLVEGDFSTIYPWPDVCLIFLRSWMAEGHDRTSLEADDESAIVIENVASLCPKKTVVITHSGGPNTMPWASNPNISAIIAAHYPGQESGNSIVDVLFGDTNPSGKLPYTIAKQESDYNTPIVNSTNASSLESDFDEGLFIDYRHFDANDITPLYEFGYGLSYTNFTVDSISVAKIGNLSSSNEFPTTGNATKTPPGGPADLWAHFIEVAVQVKNTGSLPGATVPQLYVSLTETNDAPKSTPVRVLRGFEKVLLDVGQTEEVKFVLNRRDVSFWDVEAQKWRIPRGKIGLEVGLSSRDIKQKSSVTLL